MCTGKPNKLTASPLLCKDEKVGWSKIPASIKLTTVLHPKYFDALYATNSGIKWKNESPAIFNNSYVWLSFERIPPSDNNTSTALKSPATTNPTNIGLTVDEIAFKICCAIHLRFFFPISEYSDTISSSVSPNSSFTAL